ncbi:MAG: FG-GAP repeat protein [Deltaproteobacteria bacterium]|nr:FG-GAP repeat protein [Deltaproteobacteria bacterium]
MWIAQLLVACDATDTGAEDFRPSVQITSPGEGGSIVEGATVSFVGIVSDDNDDAEALSLIWTLDGLETLTGSTAWEGDAVFFTPEADLSVGEHGLRLTAIDTAGNVGSDDASFSVVDNEAPDVTFVSPLSGDRYIVGDNVTVEVEVEDDEDDLSRLSFTWGGSAAEGADLPASPDSNGHAIVVITPPAGDHDLSLTVVDTNGASATELVTFEVVDGDEDGDGFLAPIDGGEDCDDTDAAVNPDATETCNDTDDDCDGDTDEGFDSDSDGLADCYDTEKCDNKDNDGDGQVDEDDAADAQTWYYDADGDGYGDAAMPIVACDQPLDTASNDEDCDDSEATVNPGAREDDCTDPNDYNCDGATGYADNDGDGAAACADCDDTDASVYPGQVEVCDDIDNDCDGTTDGESAIDAFVSYADADGDGYGDSSSIVTECSIPAGHVATGGDCDDSDDAVNPAATESCNEVDDDCDGATDDDDTSVTGQRTWYRDADDDGYGETSTTLDACDEPSGYTNRYGDCDDADSDFHPGASESDCSDPNDYNCDGSTGFDDNDSDGYAACEECDDGDSAINPTAVEVCDDVDNDCSGDIDGADATDASTWYADADGDGYGDSGSTTLDCEAPAGFVGDDTDCDDSRDDVSPGASERCDSADTDEDCDGVADDSDSSTSSSSKSTLYRDADTDGYGDASTSVLACDGATGYAVNAGDCDDSDAAVNPGELELCDSADTDEDCDGLADDDDTSATGQSRSYADADGDSYGNASAATLACDAPAGNVSNDDDCDDTDAAINPAATEACDGDDNDCDGSTDESGATGETTWYRDADRDGYGTPSTTRSACSAPSGYVADATDCNDGSAAISPADSEVCDGSDTDEDCDGLADDDDPSVTGTSNWYTDADGDGYGDGASLLTACEGPSGAVANSSDCDDTTADVSPAGVEDCNGEDDDCDGSTDEDASDALTWYPDADSDGYGDEAAAELECSAPSGYMSTGGDCDDSNPAINPAATEACDGDDNDCDGSTDEAGATGESTWYADADSDGYGSAASTRTACDAPSGYVANATDCDDASASTSPAGTEVCDSAGADEDCDGLVNSADSSATGAATWYLDADGDGYGDSTSSTVSCDTPSGYAATGDDCDDSDDGVSPGARDECEDGIDNDCDGSDSSCNWSGDYAAIGDADSVFYADATNDRLGYAVATGMDLDGDGIDDVVASATGDDVDATDRGTANFFSGPLASGEQAADDEFHAQRTSPSGTQYVGAVIIPIEDYDGDGDDEVAVHSYTGSSRYFYLLEGPISDGVSSLSLDADDSFSYTSSSLNPEAMCSGGAYQSSSTVNALFSASISTSSYRGRVTIEASGTTLLTVTGETAYDYMGYALAGGQGADVDGDGADDAWFGAPGDDDGGTDAGAFYVMYGDTFGSSLSIASAAGNKVTAGTAGDGFGTTLRYAGDTDNDGYADVLAGAPGGDYGGTDAGAIFLFNYSDLDSSASDAILYVAGATAGDGLGGYMLDAGDLDNDGYVDLVAGSPEASEGGTDAGAVYVIYGPLTGAVDLGAGDYDAAFLGAAGEACGRSGRLGDTDGDGKLDLAYGCEMSEQSSSTITNVGSFSVVLGL